MYFDRILLQFHNSIDLSLLIHTAVLRRMQRYVEHHIRISDKYTKHGARRAQPRHRCCIAVSLSDVAQRRARMYRDTIEIVNSFSIDIAPHFIIKSDRNNLVDSMRRC